MPNISPLIVNVIDGAPPATRRVRRQHKSVRTRFVAWGRRR
jgi:hypothetical protein